MDKIRKFTHRARWIIAVVAAVAAVVAVTVWVTQPGTSDKLKLSVVWPERLGHDVSAPLLVGVTDTHTDTPAAGAEVRLLRVEQGAPEDDTIDRVLGGEAVEVDTARTGQDGVAELTLPSVVELDLGVDSDEPPGVRLVVVGEHDSKTRYASRTLQAGPPVELAAILDRPLYQPGQKIHARVVSVRADTGRPHEGSVEWRLKDPRGNLIYQETGTTSAAGVASNTFPLAEHAPAGDYDLAVEVDGARHERTLKVKAFRLPRFTVDVEPAADLIEPGDVVAARVVARYTYGDAVADAKIDVDVSVQGTQQRHSETFSGRTDADGRFSLEWYAPQSAQPGASVQITATVTSAAGRAESASAPVAVSGGMQIDIEPARRARFLRGQDNTGFVTLRDGRGEPLSGRDLRLQLDEYSGERTVDLKTDALGRASFAWKPRGTHSVSVEVRHDDRVVDRRNVSVDVGYGRPAVTVSSPVATVSEPFEVGVSETGRADGSPVHVVALRDGYPVDWTLIEAGEMGGTMTFSPQARGLVWLTVVHETRNHEPVAVWVRQRGGDEVGVGVDSPARPGESVDVELSFAAPAGEGAGEGAPQTTFGLVGVDEALYALEERADPSLAIVLRRAPQTVLAGLKALGAVGPDDADGLALATGEFQRHAGAAHASYGASRALDISSAVADAQKSVLRYAWLGLLAMALLALMWTAGRATWQAASREALSWKRALAQLGVAVAAGVVAIGFIFVEDAFFAGGFVVWASVVVVWAIAAALRHKEMPLGTWLWSALGLTVVVGCLLATATSLRTDVADVAIFASLIAPAVLLSVSIVVFCYALQERDESRVGLAMVSLLGIALLGGLGLTFGVSGATSGDTVYQRESRPASMAEEASAPPTPDAARPERKQKPAADADQTPAGPRVRSWFPETMVWLPEINAEADGRATANFEVPDSITTWRLDVWAHDTDGRFGHSQAELVAVKPTFAELDLPTHLVDGDRLSVPVTLVNRTSEPLRQRVTVTSDGALSARGGSGSFEIEPRGRRVLSVDVRADGVGDGTLTVIAIGDGDDRSDAVRRTATVRPDGRTLRRTKSALVDRGFSHTETVPPEVIVGTLETRLKLIPGMVASALDGLDAMLSRPTGCFEQTASANYPNVMVLRALERTEPVEWPDGAEAWQQAHERATELVGLGYQRMLTFQHPSGGFSLYPDRNPDILLTAYGILQLADMHTVRPIDEQVLKRAASYLVSRQNQNGSWPAYASRLGGGSSRGRDIGQVRATAFVALALASMPDAPQRDDAVQRALERIVERVDSASAPDALALAATALSVGGRDDAAGDVADRLANSVTREGDIAYWSADHPAWMGSRSTYADLETTAMAAYALLEVESHAELLPRVLAHLAESRSPWGGWGTTQATAWALMALERLGELDSGGRVQVSLAGQRVADFDKLAQDGPVHDFGYEHRRMEPAKVEVRSEERSSAMVQAVTEFAVPWDSRLAHLDDEPLTIDVDLDERALAFGAAAEAVATVENTTEDDMTTLIVELPLPAGAYAPEAPLDELVANTGVTHYERTPTHMRLYLDELPARQRLVIAYELVPLVRGSLSFPPARAYRFYTPEPTAESNPGAVRVR